MIKPTALVLLPIFLSSSFAATLLAEEGVANRRDLPNLLTAGSRLRRTAASDVPPRGRRLEDFPAAACYDHGALGVEDALPCAAFACSVDYVCLTDAPFVVGTDLDVARFSCPWGGGFEIMKSNDRGCTWLYACCELASGDE